MTLIKRNKDPPFFNQMADEHPRQPLPPADTPGFARITNASFRVLPQIAQTLNRVVRFDVIRVV